MAEYITSPDRSVLHWSSGNYWTPVPSGGITPPDHYQHVAEGIANKSSAEYWRGNVVSPVERNILGFPADVPGDLTAGDEVHFLLFFKGLKVVDDPGVRCTIYYDRLDIPSTAAGTDTTHVYTTGGKFANIKRGDFFTNLTRQQPWPGDDATANVYFWHTANHIELQFAIAGQTVGDHIDIMPEQETKLFHIDTAGQWKAFRLVMPAVSMTPEELDDMEARYVSAVGTGGEIPGQYP